MTISNDKIVVVERLLRYTGTREWIEKTLAQSVVRPQQPRRSSNNCLIEERSCQEFLNNQQGWSALSKGGDQTPT